MTPTGQAAFYAGIRYAAEMGQIAAFQIELWLDADHLRHRTVIEALRGLADDLTRLIHEGVGSGVASVA